MKRSLLLIPITLAALACAKPEPVAAKAKTPPPLPADVAKVSAAVTATDTASSTANDGSGAPSSALATEAGGTIVATGEFVSPVRSELAAKLPGRVGRMYVDDERFASTYEAIRPGLAVYMRDAILANEARNS